MKLKHTFLKALLSYKLVILFINSCDLLLFDAKLESNGIGCDLSGFVFIFLLAAIWTKVITTKYFVGHYDMGQRFDLTGPESNWKHNLTVKSIMKISRQLDNNSNKVSWRSPILINFSGNLWLILIASPKLNNWISRPLTVFIKQASS